MDENNSANHHQPPWNSEVVRASLQSRQDFCRYNAQAKERSTLLPTQPVWVQDSTNHRLSQGVVKSKAETPRSYFKQTPQDEYRRNGIHLKETAMNTAVSACTTSHRMCKVNPLFPHRNLPVGIKGIPMSQLSVSLTPKVQMWWKKLTPRNQGGHPDHINPTGTT